MERRGALGYPLRHVFRASSAHEIVPKHATITWPIASLQSWSSHGVRGSSAP